MHDITELFRALRQGDVQALFTAFGTSQQQPQGKRRLAGARRALEEVHTVTGQAARQHDVQPLHPRRKARLAVAR
jgi:hypothetical protein